MAHSTLCKQCRSIFEATSDNKHVIRYDERAVFEMHIEWHPDFYSLQASAEKGCELCAEVWHGLVTEGWPEKHRWPNIRLIEGEIHRGVEAPRMFLRNVADPESQWFIVFAAIEQRGDPPQTTRIVFGTHFFRAIENHSVLTERSFYVAPAAGGNVEPTTQDIGIAQQWLLQCQKEHDICRKPNQRSTSLPSRLIQVWKGDKGLEARLLEREEIKPGTKYISLSHCWGSGPIYTLNSSNVARFKKSIPFTELAHSFRDTLDVANRLGYAFVWIDCLCILQDSVTEWATEVNQMADVYENASLNIAATAFTSSNTGLFVRKKDKYPKPLTVQVDVSIDECHLKGTFELIHEKAWTVRVDKAPLNERAWVLQERFFSARILHFGKDQLLWECQQLQASETSPSGLEPLLYSSRKAGFRPYRNISALDPHSQRNSIRLAWYNIIGAYTGYRLTYSSDKFAAIAGITMRFQELLNDTCIAGLWRNTFVEDLLWSRAWNESRELPRALDSRAPSWSWACLDCSISHPIWKLSPLLIATLKSCERRGLDDTSNKQLCIQAPLVKAISPSYLHTTLGFMRKVQLKSTEMELRVRFDGNTKDFDGIWVSEEESSQLSEPGRSMEDVVQNVWIYMLFISAKQPMAGLLLKRESAPGRYSRIGYFDTFCDHSDPGAYDLSPLRTYLEDGYEISHDDFEERHPEGFYSVTIV